MTITVDMKRVKDFVMRNKKACAVAAIALPIIIRQHNTIVTQRCFIAYKGLEDEYYTNWM